MEIRRLFTLLVIAALLAGLTGSLTDRPALAAGPLCYVKSSASGLNDGSSWTNAYTSLQSALAAAGCTEIWVAAGTYKPGASPIRASTFMLKNGVAIYGGFPDTGNPGLADRNPAANVTTLSGDLDGSASLTNNDSYHVVRGISVNNTAVLDGFTITGGNANGPYPLDEGGGLRNEYSSPTLANIIFSGNSATMLGGGLRDYGGSSLTLTHVTFSGNRVTDAGGWGGGMASDGSPTLTDVTFSGNSAGDQGGGLNCQGGNPTLTNVTFSDNSAGNSGGGMLANGSHATLSNVTFSSNSTTGAGGGLFLTWDTGTTLTDVTFSGNTAPAVNGAAGGMYIGNSDSPALTNVTFSSNSAQNGGGMVIETTDPLTPTVAALTNVTFNNNSADFIGGGILINDASPTLTNVTLSGNSADQFGGGIYYSYLANPIPQVRNTILWGNSAGSDGAQIYNESTAVAVTYSVVQGGYSGTGNINADPLLEALGDNGGNTMTMPLLPGSAAIDATSTNCPLTDQRSVVRSSPACDIGAFESRGFTLTKTGGDNQTTNLNTAFATPLGLTVTANEASEPVNGGKVTFTAPSSGASTNPAINIATIASGAVSQTVTANGAPGSYNVTASATGATSVNFALSNGCYSTVTNANDTGAGSLRQAIADTCSGGTITFAGNYTITLASQLTITQNLTIDGAGHNVAVSGNNATRVFNVSAGQVNFKNLTTANGKVAVNECGSMRCGSGLMLQNNAAIVVAVTNTVFTNNDVGAFGARGYGSAINQENGSLTVSNSTFSNNTATGSGAGIYKTSGSLTVTNSTFSGNNASYNGGGIASQSGATTVVNSTFSGNSGPSGGGGIHRIVGSVTVKNTLIANSTAGGNCSGTITDGGNNLDDGSTCGFGATALNNTNPQLGAFTNGVFPLNDNSPAIDAANPANCPGTDQRGQARNDWQCDIGAFELKYADSPTVTRMIPGAGTYSFGPAKISLVVTDTNGCLTGIITVLHPTDHISATVPLKTGQWWEITPIPDTCSGFDVGLTLATNFLPDEYDKVCRWVPATTSWDCVMTGFATTGIWSISRAHVDHFSQWAAGNNAGPTSVTFIALAAHRSSPVPVAIGLFAGLALSAAIIGRCRRRKNS